MKLKNVLKLALLTVFILLTPLLMDHVKNIYLVEHVSKKVSKVVITNGFRSVSATAFQIKYNGSQYGLTNRHVCEGVAYFRNYKNMTKEEILEDLEDTGYLSLNGQAVKILAIDRSHDLCLLESIDELPAFDLASNYHIGEKITIVGHPRGTPLTIRTDRIISKGYTIFPWVSRSLLIPYLFTGTIAYPGNSGSPVINRYGNLIGVHFAGKRGIWTDGYVVPLESIKQFLKRKAY